MRNIRRIFQPVAVILIYHKIMDVPDDPFRLAVSPANFSGHLEVIQSKYSVLGINEFVEKLPKGTFPHRSVVISFDDGYGNNYHQAWPILRSHQVPATVFVTSGTVQCAQEFWWDDLERMLLSTPGTPKELSLRICGEDKGWPTGTAQQRVDALWAIHAELRDLPGYEREPVLAQLADWAGSPRNARPAHLPMKRDELRHMAQSELITIGAHTRTHPVLAALHPDEQLEEIAHGKEELEVLLGKRVNTFSYPFGKPGDYSDQTVKIVRQAGFTTALTTIQGPVDVGDDPFQLRRCEVNDWDPNRFERMLDSYFYL